MLELPLLILCCFVVFLAAANTAQARRVEFGMLKTSPARAPPTACSSPPPRSWPRCWSVGSFATCSDTWRVWLLAQATLSVPTSFSVSAAFVPQAALALGAVIIAGLTGLRRDLVTPVADLLRRVPGQTSRWGAVIGNVIVIVAALAAIVEVQTTSGPLTGIAILAPAAVILALGLLVSLLFDPFAGWWGRRAIRTGRLGSAMAMLHWARRRTDTRIVALLAVATGLVGYVAIAYGIGTIARHDQVVADLGARQVVSVSEVSMRGLLTAVHTVDPDGRYAMAVMPVGAGKPSVLAVDSPRLGVVGEWPTQAKGGLDAAAVTKALRPTVGRAS